MILQQIVDELLACGFRCEAGGIEKDLAFIALQRLAAESSAAARGPCTEPAVYKIWNQSEPYDAVYSCADHLAALVQDGDTVFLQFEEREICGFVMTV